MKIEGIQPWRQFARIGQALLILGLPFVKVGGESAVRFDVPSLRLHFFGASLWMDEFFLVFAATLFVALLIIWVTLLFGRIWCGWVCPQTVVADFTAFVERAKKKGSLHKAAAYATVFAFSSLAAANLIWYFIPPHVFFEGLLSGGMGKVTWGFWIVLTGVTFANFAFVRRNFCATVCPYAKLQSVMYDNKTLLIAFDPGRKQECINCMACVKTCPVNIDIRKGSSPACISCAECIDACAVRMAKKGKGSLIDYFWGFPGEARKTLRTNTVFIGAAMLASFVFLLYLATSRVTVDMTVLPNHGYVPVITAEDMVINSYVLSAENRGKSEETLTVGVKGMNDTISVRPHRIDLGPGEVKKVTVYVTAKRVSYGGTEAINLSVTSGQSGESVVRKASFRTPEKAK